MVTEERLEALERRLERLERRAGVVTRAELRPAPVPAPTAPAPARAVAPPPPPPPPPPRPELEDVLGGRVLAWAGGVAVLVGVVLLFAIAVSHGWIGEGVRVLLAGCASFALGTAGVWLHERRGHTEAALAATATSLAALFVTIAVASQVYDVIPVVAGTALALLVGAAAFVLAIRWRAPGIAALGLGGGLLAPVLAGASPSLGSLALVAVAATAATAVLLWQRWSWLSALTFALTTAQWVAWLADEPAPGAIVGVLVVFGVLNAVAAVGFEVRAGATELRPVAALLLAMNVLVVTVGGRLVLGLEGHEALANGWVAALAVAHLGGGIALFGRRRVPHDLAVVVVGLGVVLADVAVALLLDGAPRAVAYAGGAVAFAALTRVSRDERVAGVGLGAHVCLALVQVLAGPAQPAELAEAGETTAAAAGAVVALASACFVAGRLAAPRTWRLALDATGLAAVAYLGALTLDGSLLALAWAGEAIALAGLARRSDDPVARWGSVGFAVLVASHALVFEAPPTALLEGVAQPLAAVAALGALIVASVAASRGAGAEPHLRGAALGSAAVAGLYLASVLVIDAFQPGHAAGAALALDLGVRQQGQVVLSALWALVGTATVVAGLRRDVLVARRAGLALLLVALTKVATYDLSTLTSVYRVGSCVVLGALLLLAAFAWQRQRPVAVGGMR